MAYGARLESVLGESPRGFESPLLRAKINPGLIPGFLFARICYLGIREEAAPPATAPPLSAKKVKNAPDQRV